MIRSVKKVRVKADAKAIWDIITNLSDCSWRSDIERIEILNDRQFMECTDKYKTLFTTTVCNPCRHWELDIENANLQGHWIGLLDQDGEYVNLYFSENITVKKCYIKPFVKGYLERKQDAYLKDMLKALRAEIV